MSDNDKEKIIKVLAMYYMGFFAFMSLSVFFASKATLGLLMLVIFPIFSFAYALAYKIIFTSLEDADKRFVAFSSYGNGKVEGLSYLTAKFVIIISILVIIAFFVPNKL